MGGEAEKLNSAFVTPEADTARRARAKRGLAIYLLAVLLGSGVCQSLIIRTGDPIENHPLLAAMNMWVPAVSSLVARLVLREGGADVSFALPRGRGLRMLALAWLYPVAVGLIAYGAAWSLGLEAFAPPAMTSVGLEHARPLLKFAAAIALTLTLGTALTCVSAAGEEFGWRGYMLTRLIDAGCRRPILWNGLIWSAWHLPLILSGQYAAGPNPLVSAILFIIGTSAAGYVAARVRLSSGSIWPAVVFHGSWNAIIQGVFDRFTAGGGASRTTTIWTGESGIFVVLMSTSFAIWLMHRPWGARRTPNEAPMNTFGLRNG